MVFFLVGFVHSGRCVVFSSVWPGGVRCGLCASVPGSARAMRACCFARCGKVTRFDEVEVCVPFCVAVSLLSGVGLCCWGS